MATTPESFAIGDRVCRRLGKGDRQEVGEIVLIVAAVEGRGYQNHKAYARVRFADRTRLGGSGYRHSIISLASLKHAPEPGEVTRVVEPRRRKSAAELRIAHLELMESAQAIS